MGQTREVHVYNLCSKDTIEERVLDVLDRRVQLFQLVAGEMDMVLGNLADERDLEEWLVDAVARAKTDAEVDAAFDRLAGELLAARGRHEKPRALDEALTAAARGAVPWAAAAPEVDAPKTSQATSLAARLVVRNGLADVVDAASLEAPYLRATVAWSVEADDRYEGAFDVAVGPDGGEPEARVATLLAARATAVVAERDARLRDVVLRYTPKVEAAPVAMVGALLPAVRVRLRLRRRKAERELRVTLPAGAQALDLLACDLCGAATARPALCDDRLHLACERCVPHAQGRFTCGACARAVTVVRPAGHPLARALSAAPDSPRARAPESRAARRLRCRGA